MDEHESLGERFGRFMGGSGFTILLLASLATIAVTAWLLTRPVEEAEPYAPITLPVAEPVTPAIAPQPILPTLEPEPEAVEPLPQPVEEPEELPQPVEVEEEAPLPVVREDEPEAQAVREKPLWPVNGEVLTPCSPEALVYSRTMDDWRVHHGVDVEAALGTRVMAMASGTVTSVRTDDLLGTVVTIEHPEGLKSVYANLAAHPTVSAGDAVAVGAVIGSVGDTALGEIAEPGHLHWEVYRDGVEVDPREILS